MTFFFTFPPYFPVLFVSVLFSPSFFSRTFSRTFFFSYFFFVIFPVLFFGTFFSFFFPYYFTVLYQTSRRLKSNVLKYQWVIFLVSRHLRPIIQSETRKKNQSEEGCLPLPPRPNNIYSDKIIIGILSLAYYNDVYLREMRQWIYREEQPDQTSKDPCSFLTNLFLWGMRQGVQSTRPQKEAWSGPQLQLDLRSMWSVLQQTGHPSTPSCPARETRGQAETTDEETSSTWTRTDPKAETYRVTTQNSHGESCWTRRVANGPRDQSLV